MAGHSFILLVYSIAMRFDTQLWDICSIFLFMQDKMSQVCPKIRRGKIMHITDMIIKMFLFLSVNKDF